MVWLVECETHLQDTIRRSLTVKRVKANHLKNDLIVITDKDISEEEFHIIIDKTGYKITSFEKQLATKKLFCWK